MAINFPESLDNLSNPTSRSSINNPSHAKQHSDANDAIEALQSKVGIDGSSDTNSIDYKLNQMITQLNSSGAESVAQKLGLEGNNTLTISGIENKTMIDSFSSTDYRTIKYLLQLSKADKYYASNILIVQDGSNINISESDIVSNTSDILANVEFEHISGIISLSVTPISGSVAARYYRTALKI